MGSTNYRNTFITVSGDCPIEAAEQPARADSVAGVQYDLLTSQPPYSLTSDDLLFETEKQRKGVEGTNAERTAFFAKSQACLRASPLPKRHGWGIHHDDAGKIALVALGSDEYRRLASSTELKVVAAMRSRRSSAS